MLLLSWSVMDGHSSSLLKKKTTRVLVHPAQFVGMSQSFFFWYKKSLMKHDSWELYRKEELKKEGTASKMLVEW